MIPRSLPSSGSWTGAAEHVQPCTTSLRCSAAWTCTGWSAATAVPIRVGARASFAPERALDEVHRIGGCRAQLALPSTHSRRPSASLTTMRCSLSSATDPSHSRISGAAASSGWASQRSADLVAIAEQRRGSAHGGVQAGGARSLPGLGDRQPYRVELAVREVSVPDPAQHTRSRLRRGRDVNRKPWVGRHRHHLGIPGCLGRGRIASCPDPGGETLWRVEELEPPRELTSNPETVPIPSRGTR